MDSKVLIVSEIGINHSGNLDTAKKLMLASKESGADLCKLQKKSIPHTYSKEELSKPRESIWGTTTEAQKRGLELSKEAYDEIDRYSKEIELPWFATPWDLPSVDFLEQYDLPYYKVASALITHLPLMEKISKLKRKTFISTGMSTMDEIRTVTEIFEKNKCSYNLFHCNSQYPCPEEKVNLRCIKLLKHNFGKDVGYSSHSVGIITPVLAIMLGAKFIEAHITLDRASPGSDEPSLEPQGFRKMVEYIRVAEKSFGNGGKYVSPEEEIIKKKLRRAKDYES